MQTINATTKRGRAYVNSYNNSTDSRISDVYTRPSAEKARAEIRCRARMANEAGEDFRILSFNAFAFSCGWRAPEGLRVETVGGSYLIK